MPKLSPSRLRTALSQLLNTIVAFCVLLWAPALGPASEAGAPRTVISVSDSAVAHQLTTQVSHTLTFSDRMGTALFAHLPKPLTVDLPDSTTGYRAGDLAYFAADQDLIIFLIDGDAVPEGGVVILGNLTTGLGDLTGCIRGCPLDLAIAPGT